MGWQGMGWDGMGQYLIVERAAEKSTGQVTSKMTDA